MDDPDPMMDAFFACGAKCKRHGWEALSSTERMFVLGVDFYFQVSTHGVDGFYRNPTGDRAEESVQALERLGAVEAAAILRQCNAAFPGGSPPAFQPDRSQLVFGLASSGAFPQIALDPSAPVWDDVYSRLVAFFDFSERSLRGSGDPG